MCLYSFRYCSRLILLQALPWLTAYWLSLPSASPARLCISSMTLRTANRHVFTLPNETGPYCFGKDKSSRCALWCWCRHVHGGVFPSHGHYFRSNSILLLLLFICADEYCFIFFTSRDEHHRISFVLPSSLCCASQVDGLAINGSGIRLDPHRYLFLALYRILQTQIGIAAA